MPRRRHPRGFTQNVHIMYIIFGKECIDTTLFRKMKLYEESGVIAFIYRNPYGQQEIELPVTFDDSFHADLTYHEIMFSYEQGDKAFVSLSYACVPSALLMKMKRGMELDPDARDQYIFDDEPNLP